MKTMIYLCMAFLLVSCSSLLSPTKKSPELPAPTPSPDLVKTLIAFGPSIEVTFDGKQCTIESFSEITTGEQVIVLDNKSGASAYIYVGRNYPGTTWQDILKDMGTPGSTEAKAKNLAIVPWVHMANADEKVSYREYQFKFVGEYHIVIEGQGDFSGIWPCGPFNVIAAP